jgi:hypothetical protein
MSGETAERESGWTTDTLRAHLTDVINERDKRYEQRFLAQESAVQSALVAQEKAVNAALTAADRAVAKAEQAQERRNEATNEFRGQLADQAATLMPRREVEQLFSSLHAEMDAELKAVNAKADSNANRIENAAGRSGGADASTATLIAAVAALASVAAIVLLLVRILTGH